MMSYGIFHNLDLFPSNYFPIKWQEYHRGLSINKSKYIQQDPYRQLLNDMNTICIGEIEYSIFTLLGIFKMQSRTVLTYH